MAYLLLGSIALSPEMVLSTSHSYKQGFVEQEKLEAPPTLQLVGRELSTLKINCRFNFTYCDPDQMLSDLLAIASAAAPIGVIDATGAYSGKFVLEAVDSDPKRRDGQGNLISVDVALSLKEWRSAAPPAEAPIALSPFKKVFK